MFDRLVREAYATFRHEAVCPLVQTGPNTFVLELFHGPTLAFKDVAMQLLARLMDHVLAERGQRATIAGATSGDTGGAAVEAFAGRERTDVFILFPHGRVSPVQQRQMTTSAAANIHALAIEGNFDDCQALVKEMFNDHRFRDRVSLSGVNSINWARIMAQIVYYFSSALSLGAPDRPISFTVPTGNFGDIFAGYAAKRMGLPIERLVIATNDNDILARTLKNGEYRTERVVATTSPSMDIQVSSNFERLLFESSGRDASVVRRQMAGLKQSGAFLIEQAELDAIRREFSAGRCSMAQSAETIRATLASSGYLLDPHTATAMHVATAHAEASTPMVVLATAHPAKFPAAVEEASGVAPKLPAWLDGLMRRKETYAVLPSELKMVEDYISRHSKAERQGVSHMMGVEVCRLSNGLTVATEALPHIESVALGVWVKSGARNEREDEHGIAHLLEHMAFKGTNRRSAWKIASEIENVGGEINAATSVETTSFYARVLADDVPLAIDILADILTDSKFDADELEREQHVILQEIGAAHDTPDDIVFDRFTETAFRHQTLGRSILGTPETVKSFTSAQLHYFMERQYGADRMVVVAAGAIKHEDFVREVENRLGSFRAKAESTLPQYAHYVGGDYRENRDLMDAQIVLGFEGRAYHVRDFYASQVLSMILGGGMSSRLFQEVREKRGLCYSVYAFHWGFSDTGIFGIHAATGPGDIARLVPVIVGELQRAGESDPAGRARPRPRPVSRRAGHVGRKCRQPGVADRASASPVRSADRQG